MPFQKKRGAPRGRAIVQVDWRDVPILVELTALTGGHQGGPFVDRTVAIDAADRCGVAGLAIKQSVTVNVGEEMAIDALHSLFQVDVL